MSQSNPSLALEGRSVSPTRLLIRGFTWRGHRGWGRALGSFVATVVLPFTFALLAVEHLLPASYELDGAPGWWPQVVTAANGQPIVVAVVWFVLFAGLGRYWFERIFGEVRPRPAPARRGIVQGALVLAPWLGVVGGALLFRWAVAGTTEVLSGSMLPTLEVGDHLLVNQLAARAPWGRPGRGEIVVFATGRVQMLPGTETGVTHLVKRVVGLPGDLVTMDKGHPVINGWRVPTCPVGAYALVGSEGRTAGDLSVEWLDGHAYLALTTSRERFEGGYRVQPGEIFVLGDARANSSDSRAYNLGQGGGVPMDSILGRVERVLVERKRNGRPDFTRVFRPVELGVEVENVDTTRLRAAVEDCLATPPGETTPPPPDPNAPVPPPRSARTNRQRGPAGTPSPVASSSAPPGTP